MRPTSKIGLQRNTDRSGPWRIASRSLRGIILIIPKRHTADWFSMTEAECRDAEQLLRRLKKKLHASDPTITGFNIGMNCGTSAGQTIFHAHIHLIPRRDGDTPNPTGGVRGVIPDKNVLLPGRLETIFKFIFTSIPPHQLLA